MVMVNAIVNACVELYKSLQDSVKPTEKEWTVVSAIVGVFNEKEIRVLSLGTGSKCIGKSSMSARGDILNDSHAEVIARRAFLKYLYSEILSYNKNHSSEILFKNENYFRVKDSVKFYFVTSMTPCGDASIMPKSNLSELELCGECVESGESSEEASKRKSSSENLSVKKMKTVLVSHSPDSSCESGGERIREDIHRTGAKCLPDSSIQDLHLPGILYHRSEAVRTKPGRGDPTLSVSCSDKIARWNSVGWQGALLSLLIKEPIMVEGIICGGGCPFSKQSFDRAVNGRIRRKPFVSIHQSTAAFPDLKTEGKKPSPSTIIWSRTPGKNLEISVNGRRRGATKKNSNKKSARNSICKKELFLLFESAVESLSDEEEFWRNSIGLEETVFRWSPREIKYGQLKMMAKEYQAKWAKVRMECFGVWSEKPDRLLNFGLEEEE